MNIEQLKAHAYDCYININAWQKELNATEDAIQNYKEPQKNDDIPKDTKKK